VSRTRQGTEKERECRLIYEAAGYQVTRSAASKGGADLIATNEYRIVFIQVKKTARMSAVLKAALRELREIKAPWIPEVDRLAWIYIKQKLPGQYPEGWRVVVCHSDGRSSASTEADTLLAARGT